MAALNNPRSNGYVVDEDGYTLCGPNGNPLCHARPVITLPHVQNVKKKNQSVIGNSSRSNESIATRTLRLGHTSVDYSPDN